MCDLSLPYCRDEGVGIECVSIVGYSVDTGFFKGPKVDAVVCDSNGFVHVYNLAPLLQEQRT